MSLLALGVYATVAHSFRVDGNCPFNCTCDDTQVRCTGLIPDNVAVSVREITLSEISKFYPGRFCHVTWPNVTKLTIYPELFNINILLGEHVFDCLSQLETFKFSSVSWWVFSDNAFIGLTGLLELDLSGCSYLGQPRISRILSHSMNFPNLTRLNLAKTGDMILDQTFIDVLCYRQLTQLDLSFNPVRFIFHDASCLCETLTILVMQNTVPLVHYRVIRKPGVCSSLQVLDGRTGPGTNYGSFLGSKCIDSNDALLLWNFWLAVQIFYPHKYVTNRQGFPVRNCSLHLYPNTFITELHIMNNDLPNFDIKLYNPIIDFIDLSYNNIETINPDALLHLPSLTKVDLSHNNLHMMTPDTNTWLALFAHKHLLQTIDLSFNKLTDLPKDTFKSNVNLQELNLQGNRFQQITFSISHLLGLEILDFRNNSVQFLDGHSRQSLQALHDSRQVTNLTFNSSTELEVLFLDNPLSCSCSSLDFLQWFVSSLVFSSSRHLYSCQGIDRAFPMTHTAVEEAQEDCDRPKHKRGVILLTSALSIIAALLLVLVMINLYKRYKRKHLAQRYADRVRLLRDNNIGFKFPVFLSYCSDDREFVLFNILRPLRVSLFSGVRIYKIYLM